MESRWLPMQSSGKSFFQSMQLNQLFADVNGLPPKRYGFLSGLHFFIASISAARSAPELFIPIPLPIPEAIRLWA